MKIAARIELRTQNEILNLFQRKKIKQKNCIQISCFFFNVWIFHHPKILCFFFTSSRPGRPPKRGPVGLLPSSHLSHHPQMKKHRLDNGDYPYENGHMNGEFNTIQYCLCVCVLLGSFAWIVVAHRGWPHLIWTNFRGNMWFTVRSKRLNNLSPYIYSSISARISLIIGRKFNDCDYRQTKKKSSVLFESGIKNNNNKKWVELWVKSFMFFFLQRFFHHWKKFIRIFSRSIIIRIKWISHVFCSLCLYSSQSRPNSIGKSIQRWNSIAILLIMALQASRITFDKPIIFKALQNILYNAATNEQMKWKKKKQILLSRIVC